MVKKGNIPWNKGKKGVQVAWNKGKKWNKDRVHPKPMLGKPSNKKGRTYEEMYGKGKIVWNKGLKGSVKKNKTSFKKGQVPWNKGLNGAQVGWNKGKHIWKNKEHPKGMLGKKMSEETKLKMSEASSGEKHHNWMGGKSFEPYDKTFNIKFKNQIRKRDNQICMVCGNHREKLKRALDVHHINYDKLLSIPQNCIALCNSCHTKTGFNRKHWIVFFQNLLTERYDYKYDKENIVIDIRSIENNEK